MPNKQHSVTFQKKTFFITMPLFNISTGTTKTQQTVKCAVASVDP
jgi:hypothetical protein